VRRRVVVVVRVRRDALQVRRVRLLAALRQEPEVFQDVVLRVGADPYSFACPAMLASAKERLVRRPGLAGWVSMARG
jgi:hypothetical protein